MLVVQIKNLKQQIGGDKRSIGLLFLAPIFVLLLLNVILTASTSTPNIEVVDTVSVPSQFYDALKKNSNIKVVHNKEDALADLKDGSSDAFIIFNGKTLLL